MTMRARDALDFQAIALVVGTELRRKAPLGPRRTLHAETLEAIFGSIEVLTDLDLLIVLESALHEALRETCADLESYSGRRCGYEIERQDDRVRSALLTCGRRVELAPVGLRDVSRFP
jgi:hypothetical protein